MQITICPDSFKGSLSAKEVSNIMAEACSRVMPNATFEIKPMADGGEGTVDALVYSTNGEFIYKEVTNAIGKRIKTYYGTDENRKTAYLEVANIAGLTQLQDHEKNPFNTTTYGLGEMIKHALDDGFNELVIGLGGSATNDGGLGLLQALGVKFFDDEGGQVGKIGKDLLNIKRVDFTGLDQRISQTKIDIASDVEQPLCGKNGASFVFGPQKGATIEQVKILDHALERYATLIEKQVGKQLKDIPGAGAAGGLGFALMSIGGVITSGAKLVSDVMNLEKSIKNSQLVITGEGKSDEQTLFGKVPSYVATLANKYEVPVILISGSVDGTKKLREKFTAVFSIVNRPMKLAEAIELSEQLLFNQVENVMKLIKTMKQSNA